MGPIFVEFYILNNLVPLDETYYKLVSAFISRLLQIRRETEQTFIVLCPLIRRYSANTATSIQNNHIRNISLARNMLIALCWKCHIPVFDLQGIVNSCQVKINPVEWSYNKRHNMEPLFNYDGTSTRELIRRIKVPIEDAILEVRNAKTEMQQLLKGETQGFIPIQDGAKGLPSTIAFI